MMERQIRFNRFSGSGEQIRCSHRYVFLLINEPKEIKRIRQRISEQLSPLEDSVNLGEGLIEGSGGLHYEAFAFSTDRKEIPDKDAIYRSKKFKRDRNLREGNDVWVESYVKRI